MTAPLLLQVAIAVLTLAAVFLLGQPGPRHEWAYPVGYAASMLWAVESARHGLWGMGVAAAFMAWVWAGATWTQVLAPWWRRRGHR